jgi:site-specific DNA recombinase
MARRAPGKADQEIKSVAAYLRVSTDEQARSGLGLDAQRAKVLAMAQLKDWPEPVFYIDDGISGTKETRKRPKLAAMMAAIESGQHQAVIISSLDRLARKIRLTLELVDEISQHAVLVSCKEAFDTTTPAGYLFLGICALMAQYERDLIAERTRSALAELSKRSGDHGGRIPYGYVRTPKGVAIQDQQARVVRLIFAMRTRDKATLRAIAERLNKSHIPASHGGAWCFTSVREILAHQETYQGSQRGLSAFKWPVILRRV